MALFQASFGGVDIDLLYQPSPNITQGADVNIRHMPGGPTSYIDTAGQTAERVSASIFLSNQTGNAYSRFTSLKALVGTQGTLVYIDQTFTAVLLSLQQTMRYLSGDIEAKLDYVVSG